MSTAESEVIAATKGEVLSADLEKVGAALTEYSKVDAGLAELRKTYGAVIYDVKTTAGMDAARKARLAVREPRYRVEEIRKSAKAPLLALGKQIDGEAKRITAALLEIETPIDEQIRAEETRRETERKAKEDTERARVLAIQTKLAKLQSLPEAYTSALAPAKLAEIITQLEAGLTFDYQEFADTAEGLRQVALVALRRAHVEAIEREECEAAAEAARAAEEARLAAERAAEAARIAAEQAAAEEWLREERAKLEAEQAEQQRVTKIRDQIAALSGPTHLTATDSPALIEQAIRTLEDAPIDERYGEFGSEAAVARAGGIARLTQLCNAAHAHKAEQERLSQQRAEQEQRDREQQARQAEIDRKEREQREAEQRREAQERAETARREAEEEARAHAEQKRRELGERIDALSALDIAQIVADHLGTEPVVIAARVLEIPRKEWLALTMSDEVTP